MEYRLEHPETRPIGTAGQGAAFEGLRCLITGASSGIGYGMAERLLQRGAAEVLLCSRSEARMREAAETLNVRYGRVRWRALDVRDAEGLRAFADEMAAEGPIDFLFANAGVSMAHAFEQTERGDFERVMDINFWGVYNADRAVLGPMLARGGGTVLNVASMEGYIAAGYHSAYVSSKFAVMGLTEALRQEYRDRGIRFAAVCPGPVRSNIWGRDNRGEVHTEYQAPENALTELEAADEILAGLEEERNVILVTDTARIAWQKQREKPDSADRWAIRYTEATRRVAELSAKLEK